MAGWHQQPPTPKEGTSQKEGGRPWLARRDSVTLCSRSGKGRECRVEIALSLIARYTSGGAHTRWAAVGEARENLAVASVWRKRNEGPPRFLCVILSRKRFALTRTFLLRDSFWIGIERAPFVGLTKGAPCPRFRFLSPIQGGNISRPRRCLPGRRVRAKVTDLSAIGRSGNERVRGRPFNVD